MKPLLVISCPIETMSGYGARSRDIIKALLKYDKYEIKVISQRWGNTAWNALDPNKDEDKQLLDLIWKQPQLPKQPDVWIQVTVPNEFQAVGKYNIGITAGIETTICDPSWIEGINRMDLTLVSSNHAKKVFEETTFEKKDNNTNQTVGVIKLSKPVEVLFEGVDLTKYNFVPDDLLEGDLVESLDEIKEEFCYLFVGHWLQGDFGEDRKNVWYLIKAFLEVFKNKTKTPALILKTNSATTSLLDRDTILEKIDVLRKSVNGRLPNIYLIHGDLEDEDMNDLYNHSKVKAMVSFTKGEGFGRPLLEFTLSEKPVIASGWSGHIDFLDKDASILIGGELKPIHSSAQVPNMLIEGSQWFAPDDAQAGFALKDVFENYKKYLPGAKKQANISKTKFSFEAMTQSLGKILDEKTKPVPKFVPLALPKLKLPTLKKAE